MTSLVDWRRVTGQTEQSESKERGQLAGIREEFVWDALKLESKARCCTGSCLQVLVTCLV